MINKNLLNAIENATRATRILEDAGGGRALRQQIEEATKASRILDGALGGRQLAEQIKALQEPAFLARQAAFQETFSNISQARLALGHLPELHAGTKISVIQQIEALRLPRIDAGALANFQAIDEQARQAQELYDTVFQPSALAARELALQISILTAPHKRFANDVTAWSQSINDRMQHIGSPWAFHDQLAISGLAFGNLARLVDVTRYDDPFSEATSEIVLAELGGVVFELDDDLDDREVQYDEVGRNPSLIAFPEEAYSGVILAAGFSFSIPPAPVPQPIENVFEPVSFDDVHYRALREVEGHLRDLIARTLAKEAGPRWLAQRVQGTTRQRWLERQECDRAEGRQVFDLLYYADFVELGSLMGQNNNWPLFAPYFGSKDSLMVSLLRLSPIRNAIAHGRPLSQTDTLYIAAESMRLLRAMGVLKGF